MFTRKTKLRREKAVGAKAQPARAPSPAPAPDRSAGTTPDLSAGSTAVPGSVTSHVAEPTHNSGTLIRFLGLLTLLVIAAGSLIFAITQSSPGGIGWMAVTVAITGICFYFALQEFSGSRHVQNR